MKSFERETLCNICYQLVHTQGSLKVCQHFFCYRCIRRWSKIKMTCPMCRQAFTTILKAYP